MSTRSERLKPFSRLDLEMERFKERAEEERELLPLDPWSESERGPEKRDERIRRANESFESFDQLYFPPELYRQGYSEPTRFHRAIADAFMTPGLDWICGPRKHAKTATSKKAFIWMMLCRDVRLAAVMSEHLMPAQNILNDVQRMLTENARICEDYGIEILEDNADQLRIRVRKPGCVPYAVRVNPLAAGRSARGTTDAFDRPELIYLDDFETKTSPKGEDGVQSRLGLLKEAKSSLADRGSLVATANNFEIVTLSNYLIEASKEGTLATSWRVHVFAAWSEESGPLWPQRYPATTEEELRELVECADDYEWDGEYQQAPKERGGNVFPLEDWTEYDDLPDDAVGVLYADQNLALKSKGDTTCAMPLLYSRSNDAFYVPDIICRSYSDPDDLLRDMLHLRASLSGKIATLAADGNVSQEATWTFHVRAFARERGFPVPPIEYRRYRVDVLSTTTSTAWRRHRIRFKRGLDQTPDGRRAKRQITGFRGKKASKKDDAPDAMICAHELLHEKRFVRRREGMKKPVVIEDHYKVI